MSKILITGVAGFVGTNLSLFLLDKGHHIVGIDVNDRHKRLQKSGLLSNKNFQFKKNDLAVKIAFHDDKKEHVQAIFHLAALPHVDFSSFYPHHVISNNIESFINILELGRELNVPVIFASSVEVYGGMTDKKYQETDLLFPLSPYGASKVGCEAIMKSYIETQGTKGLVFRFTNLYGPWQAPDRLIPRIIAQIILG
jgi:dTDP-glucose 4,6-dehydratase